MLSCMFYACKGDKQPSGKEDTTEPIYKVMMKMMMMSLICMDFQMLIPLHKKQLVSAPSARASGFVTQFWLSVSSTGFIL